MCLKAGISSFYGPAILSEFAENVNMFEYTKYWVNKVNGIIFGKPYDNKYYDEYKKAIIKVVRDELKLDNLPIMYNMNFGHTAPMMIIPYGAIGEIDCDDNKFSILESGVI